MSELLGRAVQILDVLSRAEADLAIRDLAARIDLPKSTVQRLLRGLVDAELAVQDPTTRQYRLGPRTLAWGMAYQRRVDVRAAALPHMRALRDRTGETVGLSVAVGEEMVHIDQVESTAALRRTFEIGRSHPLWSGAPSRLLLAAMDDADVERIVRRRQPGAVVPVDPPTPERLLTEVRQARTDGYAVAVEETIVGVNTAAAPIHGDGHQLLATISVTGPSVRLTPEAMNALRPDLLAAATAISTELGAVRI